MADKVWLMYVDGGATGMYWVEASSALEHSVRQDTKDLPSLKSQFC
jgi:hypothetical protein